MGAQGAYQPKTVVSGPARAVEELIGQLLGPRAACSFFGACFGVEVTVATLSFDTAIGCHRLPLLRDLHSNLAALLPFSGEMTVSPMARWQRRGRGDTESAVRCWRAAIGSRRQGLLAKKLYNKLINK
jgi:hypothetical protein